MELADYSTTTPGGLSFTVTISILLGAFTAIFIAIKKRKLKG
jgi:hypothetical protein